jgi:protein-S-isoprenylcysteine O-methyltransferase Ste14
MIETNVIVCVILWAVFGFQHSLLARPSTKILVNKIFGYTFETHFYPILYFISQCIVFLVIYDIIRYLKPTVIIFEISNEWIHFIFWFNRIANLFLIITVFHFDIGKFTGISQIIKFFSRSQKKEKQVNQTTLNSQYLYKYIRHPMYLGILLVFVSSTTIYTDLFFVSLISIVVYIEIGSHFEEKSLIKKFGSKYVDYQQKTKRYIPGIR